MSEQIIQALRYSDEEIKLIKSTFAENEALLKSLKKFFLQMGLTEWDEKLLSSIKGKNDITKLFYKVFLPSLSDDLPLERIIDLWKVYADLDNKRIEEQKTVIEATKTTIKYVEQQLAELEGEKEQNINYNELTEGDVSDVIAYKNIASVIIGQLVNLKAIAGQKEETPEEQKKRLERDSNK